MFKILPFAITLALSWAQQQQPVFYRYETKSDVNSPVKGYRVEEGSYYPDQSGAATAFIGGGYGGYGGVGAGGIGGGGIGYGGGIGGAGLGVGGIGAGGIGLGGGGIGLGAGKLIAGPGFVGGGIGAGGYGGGIGVGGYGGGIGVGGYGGGIGAGGYGGGIGAGGYGGGIGVGGYGGGIGAGGIGLGAGGLGVGAGIGAGGIGIGGIGGAGLVGPYHHGFGGSGEVLNKAVFSDGKKKVNDEGYEKVHGSKGGEFNQGQLGFNAGKVAEGNVKGDSGYYNEQEAGKKATEDEKFYNGGQHFDKEGKQGGEKKEKAFKKKGHSIKGYKSSHHKDEDGKTEEFYDEEHHEGDNFSFGGQHGSFGEKAQNGYKGGHDNGIFKAGENKKQGHYNTHHLVDKSGGGEGQFGEKKYGGNGVAYGSHNGIDAHSLLGHQEANKVYKQHHIPFYGGF